MPGRGSPPIAPKKSPAEAGLCFGTWRRYLVLPAPGSLEEPLADPPLEPPEVAPALAGADGVAAVVSRLPSSSASTRRSGCRQAISFWFLLLSGPILVHSLPVTGSLLPLPSTCRRLEATPFCAR